LTGFFRLLQDGALDSSWVPPPSVPAWLVYAFAMAPDDSVVVFTSDSIVQHLYRLVPDASGQMWDEPTFAAPQELFVGADNCLAVENDGSISVGVDGMARVVLESDGSVRNTTGEGAKTLLPRTKARRQGGGVVEVSRLENGTSAVVAKDGNGQLAWTTILNGQALAVAVDAVDRVLVAGEFYPNGDLVPVMRLLSNGAVDPSFNIEWCPNRSARCVAADASGRVILGGDLGFCGWGTPEQPWSILRLTPDGLIDSSFGLPLDPLDDPDASSVEAVAVQPDGKILALGHFHIHAVAPWPRSIDVTPLRLVRLAPLEPIPIPYDDVEGARDLGAVSSFSDLFWHHVQSPGIPTQTATIQEREQPAQAAWATRSTWYRWSAPSNGSVSVSTDTYSAMVTIFQGQTLASLVPVTVMRPVGRIDGALWQATAGESYLIAITTGDDVDVGRLFILNEDRPANDNFANATLIGSGPFDLPSGSALLNATDPITGMTGLPATSEAGEPDDDNDPATPPKPSLWWKWVCARSGLYFGGDLHIYRGDSLDTLTRLPRIDDEYGSGRLSLFGAVAGRTYYIAAYYTEPADPTFFDFAFYPANFNPFHHWINRFSVDSEDQGPLGSPQHDGITNFEKMAFGLDPRKNSLPGGNDSAWTNYPTLRKFPDHLELHYRRGRYPIDPVWPFSVLFQVRSDNGQWETFGWDSEPDDNEGTFFTLPYDPQKPAQLMRIAVTLSRNP
jgi:hypothetical protein